MPVSQISIFYDLGHRQHLAVASPTGATPNRYSAQVEPEPCPHHQHCLITRCHRLECRNEIHVPLVGRGRPRRFCSTRCRLAEHRRLA